MEIIESIVAALRQMHWAEMGAVAFGIVYVLLAARNNPWCWLWGILSCSLWTYADFVLFQLYIDGILQIFYIVMGFVGIYMWLYGSKTKEQLPISSVSLAGHLIILFIGSLLSIGLGFLFATYTKTAAPFIDSFTTVFSVFATFMLVRRVKENWLYWIVTDLIYVALYFSRSAYLLSLLMVLYTIIAISGYFSWHNAWKKSTITS